MTTLSLLVGRRRTPEGVVPIQARATAFEGQIGVVLPLIRGTNMRDLVGTARITEIEGERITVECLTHGEGDIPTLTPLGTIKAYDADKVVTNFILAAFGVS